MIFSGDFQPHHHHGMLLLTTPHLFFITWQFSPKIIVVTTTIMVLVIMIIITGLIMQSGWLYIKQLLRQVVTGGPATSLPPRLLISTLVILITLTIITIITIAVNFLIFLNGHWTCMIRIT